jgi:hypothetical protein
MKFKIERIGMDLKLYLNGRCLGFYSYNHIKSPYYGLDRGDTLQMFGITGLLIRDLIVNGSLPMKMRVVLHEA